MPGNQFTLNYKQSDETQLNVEQIIRDLEEQNELDKIIAQDMIQ